MRRTILRRLRIEILIISSRVSSVLSGLTVLLMTLLLENLLNVLLGDPSDPGEGIERLSFDGVDNGELALRGLVMSTRNYLRRRLRMVVLLSERDGA